MAMAGRKGFTFTEEQFAPTFGRTSRGIIAHFWGSGLSDGRIAERVGQDRIDCWWVRTSRNQAVDSGWLTAGDVPLSWR